MRFNRWQVLGLAACAATGFAGPAAAQTPAQAAVQAAVGQSAPATPRTTLMAVWQAAVGNDRQFGAARAEHAASQTRRDQAAAVWKPSIGLSGAAGWAAGSTRMQGAQFSAPAMGTVGGANFATSVNHGTATRWGVVLQQPLFSPARSAQSAQLALSADMGDTAWQATRSELMLQTAERYFNLAVAEERVRVLQLQRQSVGRTTQEAHDRFQWGAAPVTDTHEADAENAGIQAQLAAAELDASIKRQALADSTGLAGLRAMLPGPSAPLRKLPDGTLEQWLQAASARNLQLQQLGQAMELAQQGVRRQAPLADVSVDLVAQAGQDRLWGNGDFGQAANRNTNRMVGVQVNIPLYSGGMRSAQRQEAVHQLEKAQAQLDAARQQVGQQVRAAWWGLQAGQARIQALEQALKAATARLDATRMGRSIGDRTTLDVLNAENAYAASIMALAEARSAQVLQQLRLAALANQLDDALMQQVSNTLDASHQQAATAKTTNPAPARSAKTAMRQRTRHPSR